MKVYLFKNARSPLVLSFAARHLCCDAAVMLTASYNPPADDGFECYAANDGWVGSPNHSGIIACDIPKKSLDECLADGSIVYVGSDVDDAYIASVVR